MNKDSSLYLWLGGICRFPTALLSKITSETNTQIELSIHTRKLLHEAADYEPLSIEKSWNNFHEYELRVNNILGDNYLEPLSEEDSLKIETLVGDPPIESSPIYIITTYNTQNQKEVIVYIGQTTSETNRFENGHKAALKLHHPKYNNLEKRIYFCTPRVYKLEALNEEEYEAFKRRCDRMKDSGMLPEEISDVLMKEIVADQSCGYNHDIVTSVDWLNPITRGQSLIDSIESELIYQLQPELNTQHKDNCDASCKVEIEVRSEFTIPKLTDANFYTTNP